MVDNIFVGIDEAVESFSSFAPHAQVHVLRPAADVLKFAPVDPFIPRGIAVLRIGRGDADQYRQILEWAGIRQALYMYDTTSGKAVDWTEHRRALTGYYQHANIAICNYAKHDVPAITGGLQVVPGRLFEGLAAGAVLVGIPPDEQSQIDVLGETVVEPIDSPRSLVQVLDRFSHPREAKPLRIRNLALACRGNDRAHRWRSVFGSRWDTGSVRAAESDRRPGQARRRL